MNTIAITIDPQSLARLDRLLKGKRGRDASRSQLIRLAIHAYLEQLERRAVEDREEGVLQRHRDKLARQARALVRAQAQP
ncbi:MAG: ribbon-helix-helix protein, CopG family [Cyanobacteria bacterium]|nr:ribbon-helix-helix protein, CopG family [Cyanobacteriota bacterium]